MIHMDHLLIKDRNASRAPTEESEAITTVRGDGSTYYEQVARGTK